MSPTRRNAAGARRVSLEGGDPHEVALLLGLAALIPVALPRPRGNGPPGVSARRERVLRFGLARAAAGHAHSRPELATDSPALTAQPGFLTPLSLLRFELCLLSLPAGRGGVSIGAVPRIRAQGLRQLGSTPRTLALGGHSHSGLRLPGSALAAGESPAGPTAIDSIGPAASERRSAAGACSGRVC